MGNADERSVRHKCCMTSGFDKIQVTAALLKAMPVSGESESEVTQSCHS